MEFLKRHWQSRTLLILGLSSLLGLLMFSLEFTQWAEEVNRGLLSLDSSQDMTDSPIQQLSVSVRMILPFVKVLVFILVPALLIMGIRACYRSLSRGIRQRKRNN